MAGDMHQALMLRGTHAATHEALLTKTIEGGTQPCDECLNATASFADAQQMHSLLQLVPHGHKRLLAQHTRHGGNYSFLDGPAAKGASPLCNDCRGAELQLSTAETFHALYRHPTSA